MGRIGPADQLIADDAPVVGKIELVFVGMKGVIGRLVVDPQEDEGGAGHADCQADDVEEGKAFAAPEVAEGYAEIVFEHTIDPLGVGLPRGCQNFCPLEINQL